MKKIKYAFIINSESQTAETYSAVFETETFLAGFYAVNSMTMACETVQQLVDDGVSMIDLCGDFNAEDTAEIGSFLPETVDIAYVKYTAEQSERLEAAGEELSSYGVIMRAEGFNPVEHRTVLESDEFNTTIICTETLEQACDAANRMQAEGVNFIELCSGFDENQMESIISGLKVKIPVGSAGL